MKLTGKVAKYQAFLSKPLYNDSSLTSVRREQNALGKQLFRILKRHVRVENHTVGSVPCFTVSPIDTSLPGIILYLHGGGFVCGGAEYARGFASLLAAKCGAPVFACAYSLAPEQPFPTQLDEALAAYGHLLSVGYSPREIFLCGDDAGACLCYSLCLKLKALKRESPRGIIAISPWVDLTAPRRCRTGENSRASVSLANLNVLGSCYVYGSMHGESKPDCLLKDPFAGMEMKRRSIVSPIFADLSDMPPSLIFAQAEGVLHDNAISLLEELKKRGSDAMLLVIKNTFYLHTPRDFCKDCEIFDGIAEFIRTRTD